MTDLPSKLLRFADLATRKPTDFDLDPDAKALASIAQAANVSSLKKLRFSGQIATDGNRDWKLVASLGATVTQPCVATLAPVVTRIDEDIQRHYIADLPDIEGSEVEMPDDDTQEPLPISIDLYAVLIEALSLAVPAFPRATGAEVGEVSVTEPGIAPMTDDDAKPFAGLGALRDALANKGDDDT